MALRDISRNLAMGIAAGAVMLCASPVMALDNAGSVEGVVKNAGGQPVTGAFVRLRNAEARLSFMVVSQDKGMYTAKDLPAGKYTAQAIGGMNQSAISAPVDVTPGKAAKIDVALTNARGPQLTPAWPGRVPEVQVAVSGGGFGQGGHVAGVSEQPGANAEASCQERRRGTGSWCGVRV